MYHTFSWARGLLLEGRGSDCFLFSRCLTQSFACCKYDINITWVVAIKISFSKSRPKVDQKLNNAIQNKIEICPIPPQPNTTCNSGQTQPQPTFSEHFRDICTLCYLNTNHSKQRVTRIISSLQLGEFNRGNWAVCLGTKSESLCSWEPSHALGSGWVAPNGLSREGRKGRDVLLSLP